MKILVFLIIFIAGMVLIPESFIRGFVNHNVHISGDGEEAMDSLEFTVMLIKLALSAIIAFITLRLYQKKRR